MKKMKVSTTINKILNDVNNIPVVEDQIEQSVTV